eukprot:CAMPEP_0119170540 /NCGR_PEP_ID=MMETSP1315-20130426/19029_1 /TAXON_ID=676789 /ORGANISM="Prasinoderma singularis, Strain RCC927" /LENGTH=169 /DNA_ID=CAMNT_0007164283 /DNA_START=250 /DNA_END=759 /DNA_ORIENTATION=+
MKLPQLAGVDEREAARGAAVGAALACTPLLFVQTWIAIALYPLLQQLGFRINLPICLLANQLSNPFTALPLVWALCFLGAQAMRLAGTGAVDVSYEAFASRLAAIEAEAGGDLTARFVESMRFVFVELGPPAMLGGALAAAPVALAAYSLVGWSVRRAKRIAASEGKRD